MISVFHKACGEGHDIGADEAGDICGKYDIDDHDVHSSIGGEDGGDGCDDIGFH